MLRSDWIRLLDDQQLARFLSYVAQGVFYGLDNEEYAKLWLSMEMGSYGNQEGNTVKGHSA